MVDKRIKKKVKRIKHMERENRWHTITAVVLSLCILGGSVGLIGMKKESFSEQENRYLEAFPKWSWENVKDGSYMEDLSSYVSDHFPFRDFFMGMKTKTEIALGKREINGVYIADEGYLIEEYQRPKNTDKIIGILHNFAEKLPDQEMDLMLIPTAVWVYEEKLPPFVSVPDQMKTAEEIYQGVGMNQIDCSEDLLKAQNEQMFYRTDHHWTSYGAYQAYRAYCKEKGFEAVELEDWDKREVTQEFKGTIYSKVNDYTRDGDTITLFDHPEDTLTVTYQDTGMVTDSLYNLDYLQKKDKYSLFLDNIHPLVEIENKTAESDRVLVLIKDSYANSLVPFLAHHYKKIYVFDTRYYKTGPSKFIKEHAEITDILLLYNMNTLDSDLGVRAIY